MKWILAENEDAETYTVIYAGEGEALSDIRHIINDAKKAVDCDRTAITGFVVPKGIKKINKNAFKDNNDLQRIELPDGLEEIGELAFFRSNKKEINTLREINIPSSVTVIGRSAFEGCSQLSSTLKIPDKLVEIGASAFSGCKLLQGNLHFPATLKEMGNPVFLNCEQLSSISFAEDFQLTTIPASAFQNCSGLTGTVTIPKAVTSIGARAFTNCYDLKSVKLPDGLKEIGDCAFQSTEDDHPSNLKEINLPDSLEKIGAQAFRRCASLAGSFEQEGVLKLPKNLTFLGDRAFRGVSGLTSVEFPSTLRTVGPAAFCGTNLKSAVLYLVDGATEEDAQLAAKAMLDGNNGVYEKDGSSSPSCNIFVVVGNDDLSFYRDVVSADFNHNVTDDGVKLEDGSVKLTNVSGTITVGENEVSLPDVAGVSVSIDTDGNITVNAPITVGDVSYPYGATIAPDGTVTALPAPFVPDDYDDLAASETEINDPAVPLAAGPVTRAQFIDYLWRHEGEPEGADCTFADVPADHEYVLALGWAEANGIAAAYDDGTFQPDELVTVAAVREFLGNFASVFGTNAVAVADLTTLTGADDEAVLNCDQVLAEFFGEEYILPEELDSLETDTAA